MSALVVFAVAGIGTYLLRASMVLVGDRLASTAWLEARLALVGPAVLACLVTAGLVVSDGSVRLPGLAEVTAVVAAIVIVRRTGNLGHALFVGLPLYWAAAAIGLA
ncbi:MAG: AzlD domain-containing protein [Actinomycetota bacterium]